MQAHIYVLTHKRFTPPPDASFYVPLQLGRQGRESFGWLADDTGENISSKNPYYSELTGIYWLWKNRPERGQEHIIGTCHYRRYLLNERGELFTRPEVVTLMSQYEVVTTKLLTLRDSYFRAFGANHNREDLILTGKAIEKLCPEYSRDFSRIINGPHTYFGNMFIMKGKLFDDYCAWLFGILSQVERSVCMEGYDAYQKRLYGFLSEILLYVWICHNGLRVCECMVGMCGEKAETREMKECLARYFLRRDVAGAKAYFCACYEKRPDVLMEASDVSGELKLSMQVIATCEFELEEYGHCLLDRINRFDELMTYFGKLNRAVREMALGEEVDIKYFEGRKPSPLAIKIAGQIMLDRAVRTDEIERWYQ